MNSPVVIDRIRRWVESDDITSLPTDDRIRLYYQRFYQRLPSEQELQIGQTFLGREAGADKNSKLGLWGQYTQLLLLANEFHFID